MIYLLKNTLYLVYLFSNRWRYSLFIFFIILSFYKDKEGEFNLLIEFCNFFVFFLITISFFLFFLLNIRRSFALFEKALGLSFLNKHFPVTVFGLRAVYPVFVFIFTLLTIVLIESVTAAFIYSLDTEHINAMQQESRRLVDSGKPLEALDNKIKLIDECQDSIRNSNIGFFEKIVNGPKIAKFIEFFSVKR
jgi:hypothetical protein